MTSDSKAKRSGQNDCGSSDCYTAIRQGRTWMASPDRCESVSRMVAIDAMIALGLDPADFRTRDKLILAINPRINGTLDFVANEDIFRRAMESMAKQFVCPKTTALELAQQQLGEAV